MSINIRVAAASLPAETRRLFKDISAALWQQAELLGESFNIPQSRVIVTLSDNFAPAVDAVLRQAAKDYSQRFTTERIGGVVAAKTITIGDGDFHIVFNADAWRNITTEADHATAIPLIGHEYAHVLIERSWDESDALADERIPSITGTQVARSIARIVTAEIRADMIGAVFLRAFTSAEMNGVPYRLTLVDLWGDAHEDQVRGVLKDVHPGWPDKVESYRIGLITLEDLGAAIFQSTEGVLTLLAHRDAVRNDAGEGSVLDNFAEHPAVRIYLEDAWATIRSLVFGGRVLVPLRDVRSHEHQIMDEGSDAILAMWKRLGLEVEEIGNDEWALWVQAPQR